jgi:hypothetical protein
MGDPGDRVLRRLVEAAVWEFAKPLVDPGKRAYNKRLPGKFFGSGIGGHHESGTT